MVVNSQPEDGNHMTLPTAQVHKPYTLHFLQSTNNKHPDVKIKPFIFKFIGLYICYVASLQPKL